MKPAPFDYRAPDTLDEAIHLMATHGDEAKWLAGGQSLIPVLNFRLACPALLIDGNRLDTLDHITVRPDGTLYIGAMTRLGRLERDPRIGELCPLLAQALPLIAHPQIRNRGTLGGSLAHADPAAELPVVITALDARLHTRSCRGDRTIEAADFFQSLFTTALEPDEVLIGVEIPPRRSGSAQVFLEVARRHGDYAQVGIAVNLLLDVAEHSESRTCHGARIVYLSVGDVPMRATRAEHLLVGQRLNAESLEAAAELAANEEIAPATDIHATAEFKRHLARVLTLRAIHKALETSTGEVDD